MAWTPISKAYVFTTLFGDPVIVGVVEQREGVFTFAYGKSWLNRSEAFALDPLHFPLDERQHQSARLFPVLADALPDAWGKKLVLNFHRQAPSNEIEWLLSSRGHGVGSLAFSGGTSLVLKPETPPSLEDLALIADRLRAQKPFDTIKEQELAKLMDYGSSMGGARPKTVVLHESEEWLCKFGRDSDTFDQVRAESACLTMARACDIRVPEHVVATIGEHAVLLVKRFDRQGNQATGHFLSGWSLLSPERVREDDFEQGLSYTGLALALRKLSERPREDMRELYARMVFNVVVGNSDDHLRNHAMIFRPGEGWRLSPAFDLVPQPGQASLQAVGVGTLGRSATVGNVRSRAEEFLLSPQEANQIIDRVLSVTDRAHQYYESAGVGESALLADLVRRPGLMS